MALESRTTSKESHPVWRGGVGKVPPQAATRWLSTLLHVRLCERLGVKLPGPTRQRWRKSSRKYLEPVCVGETNESEPFEDASLARGPSSKPGVTPSPGTSLPGA